MQMKPSQRSLLRIVDLSYLINRDLLTFCLAFGTATGFLQVSYTPQWKLSGVEISQ
jgi:hypothetical protein